MAFTYILYSEKLNKFYIGACIDMDRRMYEHNIGHSKFTSTGIPWQLMYTEEFETLQEAKQREKKIKDMKSRKYVENLISKSDSQCSSLFPGTKRNIGASEYVAMKAGTNVRINIPCEVFLFAYRNFWCNLLLGIRKM